VALLSPRLRAFIPDQRGFGDSEKPKSGFSINEFAADVVAFLDATSVERATIVGHSFGSFVARQVAISNPGRIARLVLIGTSVSAVSPVTLEVQAAIRNLQDPVPKEFAREFQAGTAYTPLPPSFFDRIVDESLKLPARLWREVFDGVLAYHDLERLSEIMTPTLVIWGEHDALFSRKGQDLLVGAIRRAKLIIYPETGHCPNWERPERVAADLQGFLQQH
jgi:pimeloyl-ACP methyl ester carboxylesterase